MRVLSRPESRWHAAVCVRKLEVGAGCQSRVLSTLFWELMLLPGELQESLSLPLLLMGFRARIAVRKLLPGCRDPMQVLTRAEQELYRLGHNPSPSKTS